MPLVDKAKALVKKHVWTSLPEPAAKLVGPAKFDLYYGPSPASDEEGWPGFSEAIDVIKKATDDIGELWVDMDCEEILTREPEVWEDDGDVVEPNWENIYHFSRMDVLVAAFGGELASYL